MFILSLSLSLSMAITHANDSISLALEILSQAVVESSTEVQGGVPDYLEWQLRKTGR